MQATGAGAPVVNDSEEAEGEADTEGHGHGVLGVGGHALEDLAGANDGGHNDGETRARQHDVSSTPGSISSTCGAACLFQTKSGLTSMLKNTRIRQWIVMAQVAVDGQTSPCA